MIQTRAGAKVVHCANGMCRAVLGTVAISVLESEARGIWRIQPGWHFREGILERTDYSFRSERSISHEFTGRERPPEGTQVVREVDLPVCVRCPQCHRLRFVTPDALFRTA